MDGALRSRIAARTARADGGCLVWLGGCDQAGYPRIAVGGRMRLVRRLVVEEALGAPIDDPAIVVSDRCGNRRCLALAHLALRTKAEARVAVRCRRDHEPDWRVSPNGKRTCRACAREREAARRARRRQG